MQKLFIDGKKTLSGTINISGSKNASLPILAATILNNNTIRHALKKINSNDSKILFVLNKQKQLVTTITDGDIRRALLNSYSLNDKLDEVFKKKPIYLEYGLEEYLYIEKLKSNEISHLPLVDSDKKIIAIYCSNKIHMVF